MTPLLSRDKMTRGNPMFFHVDFLACLKSVFPHTPEKCKKCYVICSKFKLVFPRHRLLTLPAIAYAEVNRTLYKDHGGYANHITVVEFSSSNPRSYEGLLSICNVFFRPIGTYLRFLEIK